VATASTSVPPAVADEAIVVQSAIGVQAAQVIWASNADAS
jgi:hypothetical protein